MNLKIKAYNRKMNLPWITTQVDICPIPFHYDTYIGCPHGCLYCFARDNVNFRRRKSSLKFNQLEFNSVKNFHRKINQYLIKKINYNDPLTVFLKNKVPIKIGANSDPFPKIEIKNQVTYNILQILKELDYPIQVQTKRPEVFLEYADDFKDYKNLVISVTCVFTDELAKKIEPNVLVTSERFKAIKELTNKGFSVMIKCQPAIYPIILNTLDFLIENSFNSGCWAFQTEGLKLRIAASQKEKYYYLELGKLLGINNIYEYYKQEIRTTSDYELSIPKKIKYTKKAKNLSHKFGLKYFSADNQEECIRLSDGDECCGTERLHNYKKVTYNFRTKIFTGKSWQELENGLEKCIYTGRNLADGISLKDLVHKKLNRK